MKLVPEVGIDNLRFGMKRSDVERIIGKPNKIRIETDENDGEKIIIWDFNLERLRLVFYVNENNKLGYIYTSNPNVTFKSNRIINSNINDVKENIFGKLINTWEFEEFDFFNTYFAEEFWIKLEVEYEIVTHLELGVPFGEDDKYKWPSKYST